MISTNNSWVLCFTDVRRHGIEDNEPDGTYDLDQTIFCLVVLPLKACRRHKLIQQTWRQHNIPQAIWFRRHNLPTIHNLPQ